MGLLGLRPRQQNSLLPFAMADAGDEAMFAANPNGTVFSQPQQAQMAMPQAAPMTAPGMAQRDRVNPLNVLFRGLAPNLSGALDTERTRLQTEADRPAQQARLQAVLSQMSDPREQALFLGLGGDDWQKNVGQQYAPQVVAAGGAQVVNGRRTVDQPTYSETGDTIVSRSSAGVQPVYTRTAPSIAEQTAQDRLAWDRQYGTTNLGISQQNADTSRQNANTTAANAGSTLSPGQVRFDAYGRPVANLPTANAANTPEAREARASALTGTAGNISTALGRARALAGTAGTWQQYNPLARQGRVDLESSLNTIKANLTFDKLNELKAASPTGASGLGALSNQEGILLASTVAALSPDMSPGELEASFKIIDDLVAKMNQSADSIRSGGGGPAGAAPPPPPGFVLD